MHKVLTYVEYRGVQNIDPPPPLLSNQRVCPPPEPKARGTHSPSRRAVKGVGVNIGRRQTLDWPLTVKSLDDFMSNLAITSFLADCPGGGGAATAGEEPELAGWVRPATCAAIAVAAIFFFTILYYGKSWADSRTKVGIVQSNRL
jgi:hypothetical protein